MYTIHTYLYVLIYMYTHMYISMYVYIHINIYTSTRMYIHTYVQIYMHTYSATMMRGSLSAIASALVAATLLLNASAFRTGLPTGAPTTSNPAQ